MEDKKMKVVVVLAVIVLFLGFVFQEQIADYLLETTGLGNLSICICFPLALFALVGGILAICFGDVILQKSGK